VTTRLPPAKCRYCGKAMRVDILGKGRGYAGNGLFCSLRHGYAWAVRHAR